MDPLTALAAIIDRGSPADESESLLAAIVDGGVFVPVDENRSVIFIGVDESGPVIPGYVSEAGCREWLPSAAGAVHCDALRLFDIAQNTGVTTLAVFATEQWAKVPLGLVAQTLRSRGAHTQSD